MVVLDELLDLDRDLLALVLHHPRDPLCQWSHRTSDEVLAHAQRLCGLVQVCKTFANRYSQEVYEARIRFWKLCAPSHFETCCNGIRALRGVKFNMSDRVDVTFRCDGYSRHDSLRMEKAVYTHAGTQFDLATAKFQQLKHCYSFRGIACADPHLVAAAYALEPTDSPPPTEWGACTRLMGKLPIKNVPSGESDGHLSHPSVRCSERDFFRRKLRRGPVAALKGTVGEHEPQVLELLEVEFPRELMVRVNVSGGFLCMDGTLSIHDWHFDIGNKSLRDNMATAWFSEASRHPVIEVALKGINVFWHKASFSATLERVRPFPGVMRQRVRRTPRAGPKAIAAPPQGRCAESDSSEED